MGAKQKIPNGSGGFELLDYDALRSKLRKSGLLDSGQAIRLLMQYFPKEYKADICLKPVSWDQQQKLRLETIAQKRWDGWFKKENKESRRKKADPYNGFEHLLFKARREEPRGFIGQRKHRVSDFSNWVFHLDHRSYAAGMRDGKRGERIISLKKARVIEPVISGSNWKLFFKDDFSAEQDSLVSNALVINETPICGKPDYVYYNEKSRTALIVEVKVSGAEIPNDAWPNLRAQLWAYAQLDQIQNMADTIILIGEVWGYDGKLDLQLRRTLRWNFSDYEFHTENQQLFDCYKRCVSRNADSMI